MSVFQKVSYQFFSKTVHRICLNIYMKLEGRKSKKLTQLNFSEKFLFWGNSPKIPPKQGFFAFAKKKKKSINMSFFTLKMVHNSVLYDSAKTACLGKIWFFSYGLKRSQPIRLQHSLIISIYIYIFIRYWIYINVATDDGNSRNEM